MTKNIIIGVLVLVTAGSLVLANIKSGEAEHAMVIAEKSLVLANQNEQKAHLQEQRAVEAAAKALIEQRKAENAKIEMEKCLGK